MRFGEQDLVQGLRVAAVVEDRDDVTVSVYGGRDHVVGTVSFAFPERAERRRVRRTLERWSACDTLVTLLKQGDVMTLLDERSLLDRASGHA